MCFLTSIHKYLRNYNNESCFLRVHRAFLLRLKGRIWWRKRPGREK